MSQAVGTCEKCGADLVVNPKTQKTFCRAKCWLNKPVQGQPPFQPAPNQGGGRKPQNKYQKDPKGLKAMVLSYAKDMAVAYIDKTDKPWSTKDVIEMAEKFYAWVEGATVVENVNNVMGEDMPQ
jgi:hypothetical protein